MIFIVIIDRFSSIEAIYLIYYADSPEKKESDSQKYNLLFYFRLLKGPDTRFYEIHLALHKEDV